MTKSYQMYGKGRGSPVNESITAAKKCEKMEQMKERKTTSMKKREMGLPIKMLSQTQWGG